MQRAYLLLALLVSMRFPAAAQHVTLKISVRGVFQSKVTLTPLVGAKPGRPLVTTPFVDPNQTITIGVDSQYLPGEFILRFDYKLAKSSSPYPAEKNILIYQQNLSLSVNPPYCNNPDSTRFGDDETENTTLRRFTTENTKKRAMVSLLQNFLMKYDDINTVLYEEAIEEYERRRITYNNWIAEQIHEHEHTFASRIFAFEYIHETAWRGNLTTRIQSMVDHYFDSMDFADTLMIRTREATEWMNNYVNLYGSLATDMRTRDSLVCLAGRNAIEKARSGNPRFYGWMVDYFFNGFETNQINSGLLMLAPYLKDSSCLTSKRLAINQRISGIQNLKPGSLAPDFTLRDANGRLLQLSHYPCDCRYKLVLFWAAGCDHCKVLLDKLYPMWRQISSQRLVQVIALDLDESEEDISRWKTMTDRLKGWKHVHCVGGVNSKEASAYFVLSTPTLYLIDGVTNRIISSPESAGQLFDAMR
jgi:hypothetical protein